MKRLIISILGLLVISGLQAAELTKMIILNDTDKEAKVYVGKLEWLEGNPFPVIPADLKYRKIAPGKRDEFGTKAGDSFIINDISFRVIPYFSGKNQIIMIPGGTVDIDDKGKAGFPISALKKR